MITYGSTTLTSYNTITKIEVYYYKSTSATNLAGGSWSTTKPTWENGKYIWQKIKTTYEGKLENGQFYSESDPVNITGQQGATGTAAYSYKLNASDSVIGKTKTGEYTIDKVTFTATYKQGTGAVTAYTGRFKIETTANGTTWTTQYTSSGNESSKEYTIPEDIISIRCSLYQSGGTSTLLDIVTIPVVKDGIDAVGLRDSIPYYLASDKQTGVTRLDQGWTRFKPELTTEKRYLWVYYVSRYSEGDTQPELIEIKNDIVSFENHGDESPVENCVIDIEPVQDLNGYNSPWPAGGGVNLAENMSPSLSDLHGITVNTADDGTITINGTNDSENTSFVRGYFHCPDQTATYTWAVFNAAASTDLEFSVRNSRCKPAGGWAPLRTTNMTLTFTIDSGETAVYWQFQIKKGATINNVTLKPIIVSGSTAPTSYSPYSNICPISGWSGCDVRRIGANAWDEEVAHGYYTTVGKFVNSNDYVASKNKIPVLPNTSYCQVSKTGNMGRICFYDKNKEFITTISNYVASNTTQYVFTTPANAYFMTFDMKSGYGGTYNNDISINYPATDTDYHPYTGNLYPITFPTEAGTVYGGTLDVTTGRLIVDKAMWELDTIISHWSKSTSYPGGFYTAGRLYTIKGTAAKRFTPFICSHAKTAKNINEYINGTCYMDNSINIRIMNSDATVQDWVNYLIEQKNSGTPVQVCCSLIAPIIYQLTPQEITMLTGQNYIFSNTGQTAISYYDNQTSTNPYIDYSATSAFEVAQSVSDAIGALESPYKEVEWVESNGKQYVYLDWKPPIKTWGFEADFISRNAVNSSQGAWNESTNANGYGTIFGVRNASGVNNVQLSSYNNGLLRLGNGNNVVTGFKTDHSRQTIKLHGTTLTKTDGTTATVTRVDENTAKPYCNMTVFAVYTGLRCQDTGGVSEPSSTRIYSLKFYDGTTLTVDLVGAIRKADGVTGLYDKVSRHFYPAPGMLFGDEVGNINDTDTIAESLNKADVNVTVVNKNRTRMWETAVPFNRLEDGQKITVTYSYGNVVNSIETAELPEWNESTTSGNARVYLKLTYPNGNKSEWIPCYYSQTARLTSHYGAGTPITFTYHEDILSNATEVGAGAPVVRGFFANPVYDSNYYDRRLHNNSIKAKEAITAYHLICGDEEGYQNIDTLVSFDLGYPILYATGNIAATKTATNTYEAMPSINFTYTGTIQNGEADKMLWLKGTVNGNTFTVAFGDFLTTVTPTMEDGMYYIPLGVMASTTTGYFSSSNRLYAYIDGAFQPVDTAAVIRAQDAKNLATAVYGTCSTAADTPLKEVVCENFILFDGVRIQVAFENANSTNVPSINVNNTGAKQILINQATVSESNQLLWAENAQLEFVYDGTYWVLQNAPYSLYGICSVTEEIPAKVIECAEAVICKGTTITVDFMYSNTSDNTVFNVANIAQKPLLVNGDTLKVNSRFNWHAGAVRTFYFDGQAWNMSDDIVSAYIDEYETEQDEDGIMVHPVGQKNTGWSIGSTLELLKNGVSYIKMWFDKVEEGEFSLPFIRIGKESGNHVLVGDDAVTIREDQKELAHYSSLGITFDDETPYKIGNDTTYIAFEDTDNDAKADSLRIVADSISFRSSGTEKDLRSELESLTENVDLNAQAIEQNSEIIENTQRYIQINPEVPSIKLATNDRNYLLIESNKLGFWVDANETAYMSQNQMNIPTASITNLLMQTTNAETGESIGQIGWVMRTNGHLSLKIMN